MTLRISHKHTYVPSLLSLPLTEPPILTLEAITERRAEPLCGPAASHGLFYTQWCVPVDATLSICSTLSFPHCVRKAVLCVCLSVPALQIVSSVPFF